VAASRARFSVVVGGSPRLGVVLSSLALSLSLVLSSCVAWGFFVLFEFVK
jgi:hypothetical protein